MNGNNANQNTGMIILIVACIIVGIILIVTACLLLDKYVFSKRRCKKNLKALERKFEYLHALLTGQDYQYVQRIEIISRTNLLYSDIYSVYFKRYKDIRDTQEVAYQNVLNELTHLLDKSNVKEFKKTYRNSAKVFAAYEELVNNFNSDLMGVIKPEEDARQNSLGLKDAYRDVKSKYNSKEEELAFVNDTFSKVFTALDERFTRFEALIETADYDEANNLLPEISDVIKACDKLIDTVPPLLKRANEIIPDELKAASDHYDKMISEEFPLKHINFDRIKNDVELGLGEIQSNLKDLKIANCDSRLNDLEDEIKEVEELLAKEEAAAQEFNENCDRIYGSFNNLEKEFIKVRNNLAKYSKFYIVDEAHLQELKDIQKELDDVSKDKRRLDMYVHSLEKTPYTVLIVKMRDLDNGTKDLFNRFNKFKEYLASLKIDTENAFVTINNLYFKLKEHEETLRNLNNEDFSDKFNDDLDKSYKIIDDTSILLKTIPINVNLVNANIHELNDKTNLIFTRTDEAKKY
ncbi:MAG: septation ring formation regulator EzrA, partial [Bacilli bacterium]